jgi:hypothetical protein
MLPDLYFDSNGTSLNLDSLHTGDSAPRLGCWEFNRRGRWLRRRQKFITAMSNGCVAGSPRVPAANIRLPLLLSATDCNSNPIGEFGAILTLDTVIFAGSKSINVWMPATIWLFGLT